MRISFRSLRERGSTAIGNQNLLIIRRQICYKDKSLGLHRPLN